MYITQGFILERNGFKVVSLIAGVPDFILPPPLGGGTAK